MAKFIQPTIVSQIKSSFGYTILIERKNQLNKVAASVSLGDVLDLSWTKANELLELLENESTIMLNEPEVLRGRLLIARKRKEIQLATVDKEIAELETALTELGEPHE